MKRIHFLLSALLMVGCASQVFAQTFPCQNSLLPIDQRVKDSMDRMTTDEKIGQMMQVERSMVEPNPSILVSYNIGSVLSGGGSSPSAGNTFLAWANMVDTLQTYALKTRLNIPMIYGIDALHGHNNVFGATIFPHNIGAGCTRNPSEIHSLSTAAALR